MIDLRQCAMEWEVYLLCFSGTYRTIEALAMVVVWESLYPSVSSLHWEATCKTLCREQFIPIGLAIGLAIFQEEWTISKQFSTICASEALRMEVFSDGI